MLLPNFLPKLPDFETTAAPESIQQPSRETFMLLSGQIIFK